MKKIILFAAMFLFCAAFTACDDNKDKKEKVVKTVSVYNQYGINITGDIDVAVQRGVDFPVYVILRDINNNIIDVKEERIVWTCTDPAGVKFFPENRGYDVNIRASAAPITATVKVDYNGIYSTFSIKVTV